MRADPTIEARSGTEAGASPAVLAPARASQPTRAGSVYAALDLGTNNCRLLIAAPGAQNFRVLDSFSRIVRLGEGMGTADRLSEAAIGRTIEALKICRDKIVARRVDRARLVATQACRAAVNVDEFLERVRREAGLSLEIVDQRTEATLAAAGCAALTHPRASGIVLFDIGGGSTEIVWLAGEEGARPHADVSARMRSWISLPVGVVTLAERFGGVDVTPAVFEAMIAEVEAALQGFKREAPEQPPADRFHLLGTSGTVTTLAGVHLNLGRYERRRVDGLWMSARDLDAVVEKLLAMSYADRAAQPCIGPERADLVLAGCAILEAIRRLFPSPRLRIADRGLREGILTQMMAEDGVLGARGSAP